MSVDQHLSPSPVLESSTRRAAELREDVLLRAADVGLNAPTRLGHRRGRVVGLGLAAASVAAALLVAPTLLSSDDDGRPNPLAGIAVAAERSDRPPLEDGRVIHRVELTRQTSTSKDLQIDRRTDTWVLRDGRSFERTTDLRSGTAPDDRVVTSASGPMGGLRTPAAVAGLPTDPDELVRRVADLPPDAELDGPARQRATEGLLAVLYDGYAPADVYAAALRAFGSLPGLRVVHDAVAGETTVSHWMTSKRGDEVLTFRDRDGALVRLRASTSQDGGAEQTSRFSVETVDGVPADVRRAAERQAVQQR